jgi:hypothetical protein
LIISKPTAKIYTKNMTFDHWLNEIEGYSIRQERAISDIRNCVAKGKTDDIIKWLMAAYAMGHEQGYDIGYYDANEDCKEQLDEYRMGDDF